MPFKPEISGLARLIPKGIPEGEIILLDGVATPVKSLLCQKIAFDALIQEKNVIYFTTQQTPSRLRESAKNRFGWNFSEFEDKWRLFFINGCPNPKEGIKVTPLSNPGESLRAINEAADKIERNKETIFIFDDISNLILALPRENVIRSVQGLIQKLRELGLTTFIIFNNEAHDNEIAGSVDTFVGGIFSFFQEEVDDKLELFFRIKIFPEDCSLDKVRVKIENDIFLEAPYGEEISPKSLIADSIYKSSLWDSKKFTLKEATGELEKLYREMGFDVKITEADSKFTLRLVRGTLIEDDADCAYNLSGLRFLMGKIDKKWEVFLNKPLDSENEFCEIEIKESR